MILVTASRSFVGIEVARQLATHGSSLRVIVSDAAEAQLFDGFAQVEVWQSNREPFEPSNRWFEDVEKAFIAVPPSADVTRLELKLARAAKSAGIKHSIWLSGDLTGAALPAYAAPEPGLSCSILATSVSYQALTVYLLHVARHGAFTLPEERQIAPVDARDVAAVAVAALTEEQHRGKRYVVTGPEMLSLCEIADKLSFATGVPVGDAKQVSDCENRWLGWEMTVTADIASAPDVSKADLGCAVRRIAGREPISFDDYAAEIAERCPVFKRPEDRR